MKSLGIGPANKGSLNHSRPFAFAVRLAMLFVASTLVFSTAWAGSNEDLLVSAKKGDVAGVTAALAAGADINTRDRLDGFANCGRR
jgi:hypothetical protein